MNQTRRLAAILAADVVGYSRLMGADEEGTLNRLRAIRAEVVDPSLAQCRGRVVKTTGDGLLIEFSSVVDALRCAVLAIGSTPRCRHRWDSPWQSVRVGDPGRLQRLSDSRADKLEQRAAFGLRASRALLLAIMKLQLINVCESLLSCPLLISWPCLGIAISRSAEKRPNCSTFGCVSARPIFGMLLPALRCRDRDREFDGC
jgi:hypothetical protein